MVKCGTIEVPFEGPMDAKIYLVGEAPGEVEEKWQRPFVGGSGNILDKLLLECGIHRAGCRLGNVMRVRPYNNEFKQFYDGKQPTPELTAGINYLVEDILKVKPNVVVALGNEPLKALTTADGISMWRGSILWSTRCNCKVVGTYHPAALMRMWNYLPLVMFDLNRVREEGLTPAYIPPIYNMRIKPTFEQALDWIKLCRKEGVVSFDVETSEMHITAIALAVNETDVMSIPFTRNCGEKVESYWPFYEEMEIWRHLKWLMEDGSIKKYAQNAQFDITMLRVSPLQIRVKGLVMDTMCAHHTVYPEVAAGKDELTGKSRGIKGKALGTLCSIYTKQPYYKHWAHSSSEEEFWRYNAMDAVVTLKIANELTKEMKEFGVETFYNEHVNPLIDILCDAQFRGVLVDDSVRVRAALETELEMLRMQQLLDNTVGRYVNVSSPKDLKQLLYDELKMPVKRKRNTGQVTVNEEALVELSKAYQSPIFDIILGIRERSKLLGTYLGNKCGDDGRMRCSYVIGGTTTGRLSSRESVFGTGTNLQNIPRGVCRRMFVPDEGNVFIATDLSQAEARIVAYLAEEDRLIRLFESGGDVHKQNAAWLYGIPLEAVSSEQRTVAKRIVHAFDYGMGDKATAYYGGVDYKQAKFLKDRYFMNFPAIKAWQTQIQRDLRQCRTLTTPLGRKRTFFGRWGDDLFRAAYSYIPQATVADLLNDAIIRFCNKWGSKHLMLQVHDEYIIQCPRKECGVWIERVMESFDYSFNIGRHVVRIPAEPKLGTNWDNVTKVRYSDGAWQWEEVLTELA